MTRPNPGNLRKIDYYMSPARDFTGAPGRPGFRYLLCSSPRCGSTLLGEMLYETGVAGDPLEYLNGNYIASYLHQRGLAVKIPVEEYLRDIERRRTSVNGYFGIQIHFTHFIKSIGQNLDLAAAFLKGQDRVVLLRRRDKIAQAVSLYRATRTGIYSSRDVELLTEAEKGLADDQAVAFDPIVIAKILQNIIWQDSGWKSWLDDHGIPHIAMYYEDFTADYLGQSTAVLEYLGLPCQPADVPPQQLVRLGSDRDPLVLQFKSLLGLELPPA